MLSQDLVPTRLVRTSERPRVVIAEVRPPSRLHPLYVLSQLTLLGTVALWLRLTLRFTPAHYTRHVRAFLLKLGTVGIKLGQTLGMRSDLLPAEFAAELATLSEQGTGAPFAAIRQAVERELGAPLERHFDRFGEIPFLATTSFQLHRARLRREQVWVVVKVLRPYAEQTFERDLALFRRATGWLQFLGIYPKMRWLDLSREVEEVSRRELDLRYEAAALRQLRQTLPRHGVYVPDVFADYSTRRVLVMEFIHAALMADYIDLERTDPARLAAWLQENNIEPRKVARRLFHSVWRQVLEDNFFHADMHPSNVILLRDSRLAVIDCRSVGQLEADSLDKHRRFLGALADGEYATAAEYLFLVASRLPLVDVGEVKAHLVRLWRRWENRNYVRDLPAPDKSVTAMLDGLNRVMYRYNFEAQWGLARLMQTLISADTSILRLTCDVNYLAWLRQYFRAADRRANRLNLRQLQERAVITLTSALELPRTLSANSVAQQEVLRRQARVFHGSTSKSGYFLGTVYSCLAAALLLGGALLACAFLHQHSQVALGPVLGPQLTAVVAGVPALGPWTWVAVLLVLLYCYRRLVLARREYLREEIVRRPSARPAI